MCDSSGEQWRNVTMRPALGLMGTSSVNPPSSAPSYSRYHVVLAVDDTAEAVGNRAAGKLRYEAQFKRGYEKRVIRPSRVTSYMTFAKSRRSNLPFTKGQWKSCFNIEADTQAVMQ
jgi:hypothetical protein